MLIQPTLDTLNRLKLHGMAIGLSEQMTNSSAQQMSFEERVALLLDREVAGVNYFCRSRQFLLPVLGFHQWSTVGQSDASGVRSSDSEMGC